MTPADRKIVELERRMLAVEEALRLRVAALEEALETKTEGARLLLLRDCYGLAPQEAAIVLALFDGFPRYLPPKALVAIMPKRFRRRATSEESVRSLVSYCRRKIGVRPAIINQRESGWRLADEVHAQISAMFAGDVVMRQAAAAGAEVVR